MTESRNGQVVTFYSYKGGTGRTMALANVAWILAANGKRVLVVDWDLESPGLYRFFSPFIESGVLTANGGVIELIREYEWAAVKADHPGGPGHRTDGWQRQFARVQNKSFSLEWSEFPGEGTLDFLPAGKQDNNYPGAISSMNWDDFYEKQGGGRFFDALRADMKHRYDYTLIDSRTGFSDVADICTIHLPDTLVDCFTLSDQGIDGAAQVAKSVLDHSGKRRIRVLPVPMRVDAAEMQKANIGRTVAQQRFAGLPTGMSEQERETFWIEMQVPYQAYYAYEETLATFGNVPGERGSLLAAYELLTSYITEGQVKALPLMDKGLRERIKARFERTSTVMEREVLLRYAPDDQVWAEWVRHVLTAADVRVLDHRSVAPADLSANTASARSLLIVSPANLTEVSTLQVPKNDTARAPLAVYVVDVPALPNIPAINSVSLGGATPIAARERLLKLVGHPIEAGHVWPVASPRYPGDDCLVFGVPAKNPRFTGREKDLRELRLQLGRGAAVVISSAQTVALQGMGGIGKSQLALEYAHRYRAAYDVIWWISAENVSFVEASLVDLGRQLRIPMTGNGAENARAVLGALNRGEAPGQTDLRWLLIFDNGEDPGLTVPYLPKGHGHVLITSRNPTWGEHAPQLQVDVFERRESMEHLAKRVPGIRQDEASQIAELLGDLPIAVSAAGAWLADSGVPVGDYIRQIASQGSSGLVEPASNRSIELTWDLSLKHLKERSPAAYRLFQLCSVMAPEIALDLVNSDDLALILTQLDPELSVRAVRGSLVHQISRLALLRVDPRRERAQGTDSSRGGGQILVHRVVQQVVRSRMTDEELDLARSQVQHVLAAFRPEGEVDNPETWSKIRLIWPHLEVSGAVDSEDEAVRELIIDQVRYLWLQGEFRVAQLRAEAVATNWQAKLDTMVDATAIESLRRQLLHLRFNLANCLRDLGRFSESRDIDEDVLAQQQQVLRPHHPHTLMTAGSLAADLRGLGHYRAALDRDEQTYASWLDLFGEDHPRTLSALSNLAVSYRLMGNFHAARERDDIVFSKRMEVLGEDHPYTLYTASMIGRDMRDAGDYARSVSHLRTVCASYQRTRGENARGTLVTLANLAVSLGAVGAPDEVREAAELLEKAYEDLNNSQGGRSPETLTARLSLAVSSLAMDDVDRAGRELEIVKEIYVKDIGIDHPRTIACINNLAIVARSSKPPNRSGARALAAEATERFQRVLGSEHPYTLSAQMNLAICTAEDDVLDEALALAREAYQHMRDVLGENHPNTLRGRANQAVILTRLGQTGPEADVSAALNALIARIGENNRAVEALRGGRLLHRVIDPHPF